MADSGRGIDILRLTEGALEASAARQEVLAPPLPVEAANQAIEGYEPDPVMGWACRVPEDGVTIA